MFLHAMPLLNDVLNKLREYELINQVEMNQGYQMVEKVSKISRKAEENPGHSCSKGGPPFRN